jgi:glutaredoxin-like protein DUF836
VGVSIPTVVLYTREGCHLCDAAREELLAARADLPPFDLREVDVEADEDLHSAYLERIPVFEVDGDPVSELGLDRHALERTLADARRIP